ncbi:unnamed protein product [Rhodiola kirilowii]
MPILVRSSKLIHIYAKEFVYETTSQLPLYVTNYYLIFTFDEKSYTSSQAIKTPQATQRFNNQSACKMALHNPDELHDQKKTHSSPLTFLFPITFIFLMLLLPFCLLDDFPTSFNFLLRSTTPNVDAKCDLSIGRWVRHPKQEPYYTNSTCYWIIPQHNCIKFGRPETEYLNWKWKPDGCELPPFDPAQFLNLVRGKSIAFVGDSVSRNQMQSLLCILSAVAYPVDISNKYEGDKQYFKRWYYPKYNFTMAALWSRFLVRSSGDSSPYNITSLYIDEADPAWEDEIENFDYVILSAGHWFFRPFLFYQNNKLIGCHECNEASVKNVTNFFGYRMAFRTAFSTLKGLDFKGTIFLRTFSPAHFEHGKWNTGGSCPRKKPYEYGENELDEDSLEFYLTQIEEFQEAKKKGLKVRLLDTTGAMVTRPDGHPNHYGLPLRGNASLADCVHWCLPGPIDTWNEFLIHMMKVES